MIFSYMKIIMSLCISQVVKKVCEFSKFPQSTLKSKYEKSFFENKQIHWVSSIFNEGHELVLLDVNRIEFKWNFSN